MAPEKGRGGVGPDAPEAVTVPEDVLAGSIDDGWLIRSLGRLVAVPSFGGREVRAQELMAELLAEVGFRVDAWEIDLTSLSRHPSYSSEVERDRALGVVGVMDGADDGPTLILNGHVDVVPPGDLERWTHDPFTCVEQGGRLQGRGVVDMKGPLVAALAGLKALVGRGWRPRGRLVFQSVVGEEDGGLGTLAAVLRGYTGDGAVVLEPTGLRVASAQAGALNFRLHVPGRSAHGALRYDGVSAIDAFVHLHAGLAELEKARNDRVADPRFAHLPVPFPISIGTIRGGSWPSSVPESVTAEGRFGLPLDETPEEGRRALAEHVSASCADHPWLGRHPARVEWWGGQFAPCETPAEARVVRVAREVAGSLDPGRRGLVGVPYGSDLRLLVNEGGTPGVLFGPGDVRQAHAPDESIGMDELLQGARAAALMARRYLGSHPGADEGADPKGA